MIVDIARDHPTVLREKLTLHADRIGRERIRLALPPLTRSWEEKGLLHKIRQFQSDGWRTGRPRTCRRGIISASTPSPPAPRDERSLRPGHRLVGLRRQPPGRAATARHGRDPVRAVAGGRVGQRAIAVAGVRRECGADRPPGHAAVLGGVVRLRQPDRRLSRQGELPIREHGDGVEPRRARDGDRLSLPHDRAEPGALLPVDALTELANAGAISLRADFIYRAYEPHVVRDRWRLVRAGQPVPGGQSANFDRGLL